MKLQELSPCEWPRERLLSGGPGALSNSELLAVLLRSGTADKNVLELSRDLSATCDGRLVELSRLTLGELCGIPGIGKSKAAVVMAAFELGRRFMAESTDNNLPITSSEMVYRHLLPRLKGLDHEECYVMCLSATHRINGVHLLGRGTEDSVLFEPKDALKKAFGDGARALIIAHNHPGGNPLPSTADIQKTDSLSKACYACDMELLDHIIISDDRYYSFAEDKVCYPSICKE